MAERWRVTGIAIALLLTATACFSYRGPRGVQDALERSLGADLHRDTGIKLGPISTRMVASLSGDADFGLRGLTSVGVVVFERGHARGRTPRRIEPKDLGLNGYQTMLSSSDGDEQVLILAKLRGESVHDLVLLAVDADEVVFARLSGHLDEMLASAIDHARTEGAHGVRGTVPFAD